MGSDMWEQWFSTNKKSVQVGTAGTVPSHELEVLSNYAFASWAFVFSAYGEPVLFLRSVSFLPA